MTYSIDDVREGDVVTYERGEVGQPGYQRATVEVAKRELCVGRDDRVTVAGVEMQLRLGWRMVEVQRRGVLSHAGALVFTDTGLAICDGGTDLEWASVHTRNPGSGEWLPDPDDGAEEALPVPAEPLRALLAAWDEMSDHQQRVGEGSSAQAPRVVVSTKIAAFIESTRAEWERSGITP